MPIPSHVLQDVVEEHLNEAAFGIVLRDHFLASPVMTLREFGRHPEERLLAHLDALVLAAGSGALELLLPALQEPNLDDLSLTKAAAWVLIEAEDTKPLELCAASPERSVRDAIADVAAMVGGVGGNVLDSWLRSALTNNASPTPGLIDLLASRRVSAPVLLAALQSDDAGVVESAARAARFGDQQMYLPVMQSLLDHDHSGVREAALVAALSWGSQHAWLHCRQQALDPAPPSQLATPLYAARGTRSDHQQLKERLQEPGARLSVVRAMGLAGNVELALALTAHLAASDPLEAKLAAQALGQTFGFLPSEYGMSDAQANEPQPSGADTEEPEDAAALPPLEEDDLDADLVPPPDAALPMPNVDAIVAFCDQQAQRLPAAKRVLFGAELSAPHLQRVLSSCPMGWRASLAVALGIRSAGSYWLDTRATQPRQRAQLAALSEVSFQRFTGF